MTAPPQLAPIMSGSPLLGPPTPPAEGQRSPPRTGTSPRSSTPKSAMGRPQAGPSPPASPKSNANANGNGNGLPAPIGIPSRPRSSTYSYLSSSPTYTPFTVSSLDSTATLPTQPPPSILGKSLPATRPRVGRSVSVGPVPDRARAPVTVTSTKPTISPAASPKTKPKVAPKGQPSSPKINSKAAAGAPDLADMNLLALAHNPCLADALAGGDLSAAGIIKPTPKPRTQFQSQSKKAGWRSRLFDFDHVLGALDPSRMAEATAPDPIKAVVFGAESETGLVTCRAMLASAVPKYALVALTVDDPTSSPAAAELRKQGAKVVQVDMDNPATYARELDGAKAVYLGSNVLTLHNILQHQPEPQRTEIARRADRCQLGKAVHACARAKVGHLVFRVNACGHEIVENSLGMKEVINSSTPEVLKRLGVPHTILHTCVPYDRLLEWLTECPTGLILDLPVPDNTPVPWFAMEQTGEYVLAALRNPHKWIGKDMHAITESFTPQEMAARLSKMARRPVDTKHITRQEFDSLESHERLTLRWDAWNQLVTNEYDFAHETRATAQDVPNQWKLHDWIQQSGQALKRLKH